MRIKQGTIVVGIDGSKASDRALRWAAEQAAAEHRELTVVHTINAVTPAFMDVDVVGARRAQEALHESGHELLTSARRHVETWTPGVELYDVLDVAHPGELLVRLSAGAAMVVVGSHGRGRVRSLLLGSVGVRLARHAHCPVVVLRPGRPDTPRHGVVVGVDALPESRAVLEFAYRQASLRELPLTVLHARWDALAGTTEAAAYLLRDEASAEESWQRSLAEELAALAEKYPDVRATTRLTRGLPQDVLVRAGEQMDLIVVGAHQWSGIERVIFGAVSVGVVEHASTPVAVVPVGG